MKKNKFICFEGVDGSGKTTLAKLLTENLRGQYHHSPPKSLLPIRSEIYEYDTQVRFQYYLLGNYITNEEIQKTLENKPAIVDRYIYSTIAFHHLITTGRISGIMTPDHIVYLTASWDKIEQRLSQRETNKKSEEISYLQSVNRKYQKIFSKLDNVIEIDTTCETQMESLDKIKKSLEV